MVVPFIFTCMVVRRLMVRTRALNHNDAWKKGGDAKGGAYLATRLCGGPT